MSGSSIKRSATVAAVAAALLFSGIGIADASTVPTRVKALSIAAAQKGDPYQWGASGPNRFDCSGLTYYAFRHAGYSMPRTAQSQYNKVRHISASSRVPGDLVFFYSGSNVYHVGIYAGNGYIWHAPHSGARVRLEKIWTSKVHYGRV